MSKHVNSRTPFNAERQACTSLYMVLSVPVGGAQSVVKENIKEVLRQKVQLGN
jgi:hypothetical protein